MILDYFLTEFQKCKDDKAIFGGIVILATISY